MGDLKISRPFNEGFPKLTTSLRQIVTTIPKPKFEIFKGNFVAQIGCNWVILKKFPYHSPTIFGDFFGGGGVASLTKRYHALRRLPQKVHLRISPNGIADTCTREDSETIGSTMDIFLFLSSLEARHVIFLCEGHHFVFWGWSSCRQSRI